LRQVLPNTSSIQNNGILVIKSGKKGKIRYKSWHSLFLLHKATFGKRM